MCLMLLIDALFVEHIHGIQLYLTYSYVTVELLRAVYNFQKYFSILKNISLG